MKADLSPKIGARISMVAGPNPMAVSLIAIDYRGGQEDSSGRSMNRIVNAIREIETAN